MFFSKQNMYSTISVIAEKEMKLSLSWRSITGVNY